MASKMALPAFLWIMCVVQIVLFTTKITARLRRIRIRIFYFVSLVPFVVNLLLRFGCGAAAL